ncbi:hypothetical protein [Paraflavitalea sp. CAU 1676]|uniref:glycosyltransferase family 9 protein n=1 Tax=Paraflavitalea sp. CAU 1676 TaxID=3032598 RepID=UPI0023D9B11D|nr:hypothetical protein [Paraflavitalea sp. CAU 1676]MDF2189207.1 hypothetical protein [Paraflavitalea sp. CAU 1676]
MARILLIKTGAAGDVVRTTSLLNVLEGRVTWVIDQRYRSLLPEGHPALARILSLEEAVATLPGESFDLTLSLEEDLACARLAGDVTTQRLIGVYASGSSMLYTAEVAGWFDMSLVSKLGREKANALKATNTHTFQYWLFQMVGLSFQAEPYCIYQSTTIQREEGLIGIETRSGNRWPNKYWTGYGELAARLQAQGYRCLVLSQKEHLRDYLDDVARCDYFVSGDTLAMHVALAYRIPSLAIFNCTSPAEIYDYGLLEKVESPLLQQYFYGKENTPEVVSSISVQEVLDRMHAHYSRFTKLQKV